MIIDFGCGNAKVHGAIGVDNIALPSVDVIHDLLDFPYPFDTATADEVFLNHVIEHFNLADGQQIMSEIARILKPGGILHIRVPHIFCIAAWADPTHKSAFTFGSAEFFDTNGAKDYYLETHNVWKLQNTTARATVFNWKRYRLRRCDAWLSRHMVKIIHFLLRLSNWPGAADLFVKSIPMFFVEIRWELCKTGG